MELRPIVLSVKRGVFRADDSTSPIADKEFQDIRPRILRRDDFSCQFCGFRAKKHQEVHHVNDDHKDNSEGNLVTACPLCHLAHHVGFAGATGKGTLIYLGENADISQGHLNQLVRALWVARTSADRELSLLSINMLSRLLKGAVAARRRLGTSDPTVLGDFMLTMTDESYARRAEHLKGYYLFPSDSAFSRQIQYWQEHVFGSLPVARWIEVARQRLSMWSATAYGDASPEHLARYLEEAVR
jgi:intracellular multiplication protein IcmJ